MDWRSVLLDWETGRTDDDVRELVGKLREVVVTSRSRVDSLESVDDDTASFLGYLLRSGELKKIAVKVEREEWQQKRSLSSEEVRKIFFASVPDRFSDFLRSEARLPVGFEIHHRLQRLIRKESSGIHSGGRRSVRWCSFVSTPVPSELQPDQLAGALGNSEQAEGEAKGVASPVPTEKQLRHMLDGIEAANPGQSYLLSDLVTVAMLHFNIQPTREEEGAADLAAAAESQAQESPRGLTATDLDLSSARKNLPARIQRLDSGMPFPEGEHAQVFCRVALPKWFEKSGLVGEGDERQNAAAQVLAADLGVSLQTVYNRYNSVEAEVREFCEEWGGSLALRILGEIGDGLESAGRRPLEEGAKMISNDE